MRVHLSLGSNLGDRVANLHAALRALNATDGIAVMTASQVYETEPLGDGAQVRFANLAAEIETAFEPLELLDAVKGIETALGRTHGPRWGPRIIDIDIVLCGPTVVETDRLIVPHRAFRNRAFVLTPLAEIAPSAIDPVTGRTVGQLARQPDLQGRVVGTLNS